MDDSSPEIPCELWPGEEWFGESANILSFVCMHAPLIDITKYGSAEGLDPAKKHGRLPIGISLIPPGKTHEKYLEKVKSSPWGIDSKELVSFDEDGSTISSAANLERQYKMFGINLMQCSEHLLSNNDLGYDADGSNHNSTRLFPSMIDMDGVCCINFNSEVVWLIHSSKLWLSVPKSKRRGLNDEDKRRDTVQNVWNVSLHIMKSIIGSAPSLLTRKEEDIMMTLIDLWIKYCYDEFIRTMRRYLVTDKHANYVRNFVQTKLGFSDSQTVASFGKLQSNALKGLTILLDPTWFLSRFDVWSYINRFITSHNDIGVVGYDVILTQLYARLLRHAEV